jgi:glucose/arabinose dehydrogenase
MRRPLAFLTIALLAPALITAACSTTEGTTSSLPVFTTAPDAAGSTSTTTTAASTTSTTPGTTTVATTTTSSAATTTTELPPIEDLNLALVEVAGGLAQPVFVAAPPGDNRLFVVEQGGLIQLLRDEQRLGAFLDLTALVSTGGERGLLGLAFHPGYPADPRLYVNYTDRRGDTVVAEYRVSADPDRADPASGRVLLTVAQPYRNHNGGMIAFGPDGYLYIGMGDGGDASDPDRTGQDPASLLGAILRISVDGDPYSVPSNPWAGDGGAAEVWAKGLRNPWRFSFDGDLLYIGDVGQDGWEEIDIAHVDSWRLNFGWSAMEGTRCFREPGCDQTGLEIPVLEYPHEDGNCSVTGGYVYRGSALPELDGSYFYGDYCSGMIASFRRDLEGLFDLRDWTATLGARRGLTSFGIDGSGELLLVTAGGELYRLERG